jgi:hypothetical protein
MGQCGSLLLLGFGTGWRMEGEDEQEGGEDCRERGEQKEPLEIDVGRRHAWQLVR